MTARPLTWARHVSETPDYRVEVRPLSRAECRAAGYPSWRRGWRMNFTRGCWRAGAYHRTLSEARWNAARIVGHMRGECSAHGF